MINLALGTLSDNKISYLNQILNGYDLDYRLKCYNVETGVSEKPNTLEDTVLGAKTRSKNAYQIQQVNYGIGLEGGMEVIDGCYHYQCIAAFYNGKQYFVGYSSKIKLPKDISDKLLADNELWLVEELENYIPKNEVESISVRMIVTRQEMFYEAIRNAILQIDL